MFATVREVWKMNIFPGGEKGQGIAMLGEFRKNIKFREFEKFQN